LDVVYICKNGNNEELRYSIRSIVANLNFENIWVIGGKPDWYSGNHIDVPQQKGKYKNARANLYAACNSELISESFILMNDDFYVINKVSDIPYMHGGLLKNKVSSYMALSGNTSYVAMLNKTLNNLSKRFKKDILDYELHVPMVMEKTKLKSVLEYTDFWRSRYGNTYNVGGIQMTDVKVYGPESRSRISYDLDNMIYDYISSNDDSFDQVKTKVLADRFPNPSIYEFTY